MVSAGESLGAPIYAYVERTPSRRYYSDASFTTVSRFFPELQVHWRYDLNPHLSELLRNPIVTKGGDAITINLLELCGVVTTAYLTLSHLARQTENARRSSTVEGRQRCGSFVDSPVWRIT